MGWKSTRHVPRQEAIEFIFTRLRDFNDQQVLEYLQRIVASRCNDKVLEDVMEDMVDALHELGFSTDGYFGHNFLINK